ncbi:type I-E CRISPR-associated protein Cas5/CasD [Streptomyces physcomitrii]|uniref:Type I-E CRISPR-associated protein Cas5/CasD n=1 Tax=Streptomyces physcomitrii TaxID=2724184 RepID=A0ABX1H1C7_9ACTN|nr:type I-E CRISPR-associated protein Cas5/CasD [Streptomyces physcomitrii]NKI41095.1 type I-E CRISPR-associated protein Cas5/CasD [Streptomyces physcomitrii]
MTHSDLAADAASAASVPGLLLHLAGPLQSWGGHSHFNQRDTAPHPTRSGVIGLLAAALGRARQEPVGDLATLRLTVRTDRGGVLLRDLHTVGGGLPAAQTVTTAQGKKRSGDTGTLLSHRYYLADAAFTAALTPGPDTPPGLLTACADALAAPRWPLYLGRRSCPPTGPLLIGVFEDPLHHLIHLPLAAPPPRERAPAPEVELLGDRPLDHLPLPPELRPSDPAEAAQPAGQLHDEPASFHPRSRSHHARPVFRRRYTPPREQWAGHGIDHLKRLAAYRAQTTPEGARR